MHSSIPFGILFSILCLLPSLNLSVEAIAVDQPCLQTDTVCQCKNKDKPLRCISTLGDGNCLSVPCDKGFECSCDGYHICSLAKCKVYLPSAGVQESSSKSFQCEMTSRSRRCIAPVDYTNSIRGGANAVKDATVSHLTVSDIALFLVDDLKAIQVMQSSMDVLLVELETVSKHLSNDELQEVYSPVEDLDNGATRVAEAIFQSVRDSSFASLSLRMAQKSLRYAELSFKMEDKKRKELEAEKKKVPVETAVIKKIETEIAKLNEKKKIAAKNCAQSAGALYSVKLRAMERMKVMKEVKKDAMTAFSKATDAAQRNTERAKRKKRV